jgi:uracil-DNA glycosylase
MFKLSAGGVNSNGATAWPPGWPVDSDWSDVLADVFHAQWFAELQQFVADDRNSQTIYPAVEEVFRAFQLTSLAATKVVILGQDPYHGVGQAHGLSFSVNSNQPLPPSLRNIFQERQTDVQVAMPRCGSLNSWARQGVLLLNSVLTVRAGQANSHAKRGWEKFTDAVIQAVSCHRKTTVVFVLWGKQAEKKQPLIAPPHQVLISAHPSPLSAHRGFFGSRPFSRTNQILIASGQSPIDWR